MVSEEVVATRSRGCEKTVNFDGRGKLTCDVIVGGAKSHSQGKNKIPGLFPK